MLADNSKSSAARLHDAPSAAQMTKDRVAPGRYRPGAPTDPYVHALAHTVPLIMDSLRVGDSNGQCEREQVGNGGVSH